MNPAATAAALLTNKPNLTLKELQAEADRLGMNPRDEDLFWAKVREINPSLCADW
ncbi:hypothetical protein ACBJ59_36420 [Nonomuraea sp. MTCD27]|uniref:hypothetical protein n=1 Tax=Nonomuraea sp. MTCD27 TaxID=1676747 RepID=UPI0035C24BCB